MNSTPGTYAELLDAAATRIDGQQLHPYQPVPGVWKIGGENAPAKVIGVVAAQALQEVCVERGFAFEDAMESYLKVSRNVALTPKGGPDVIAKTHLRDAAQELRRLDRGAPLATM